MKKLAAIGIDQAFGKTAVVINIEIDDYKIIEEKIITTVVYENPFEKIYRAETISIEIMDFIEEIEKKYEKLDLTWAFCIEGLSYGSAGSIGSANRDLAGLQFIVISKLLDRIDDQYGLILPPKSLKLFATNSGKAGKDDMVEALKEKYPEFYKSLMKVPKTKGRYDLADAFWLSEYIHQNIKIQET